MSRAAQSWAVFAVAGARAARRRGFMARRASAAGEIETAEAACTEWGVLGGASREGEDLGRNPAGVSAGAGRLVEAR
jgi:hypothetical protein